MDELKPEDGMRNDPNDRRSGRSRNRDAYDNEPQINVDDVDVEPDDRRRTRAESEYDDDEYTSDEQMSADPRPSRGRKKVTQPKKPISKQYLMMGTGILVLLLLIFGIGSALKSPTPSTNTEDSSAGGERSIDLSAAGGSSSSESSVPNTTSPASQGADLGIPPIAATPSEAAPVSVPEGQQRVEVQGDLSNSLVQNQDAIESITNNSTLPTAPATVASTAGNRNLEAKPERKRAVIEPVQKAPTRPQVTANNERQAAAPSRSHETTRPAATAPVKASQNVASHAPAPQAVSKPATAAKSVNSAVAPTPAPAATASATMGSGTSIKNAPNSSYTLQLSSSSNQANLNAWAKKQNVPNYLIYQTERNGKPWYVLVSGVYASKEEAERAVSGLSAGVQSNKPWTKPIHQVKSELK